MMLAQHLDRQRSPRFLDATYPWPRQFASLDDWHRLRNLDLPNLDDLDLDRERFQLSTRLAYETDVDRRAWLAERRDAVVSEQRRRAGRR